MLTINETLCDNTIEIMLDSFEPAFYVGMFLFAGILPCYAAFNVSYIILNYRYFRIDPFQEKKHSENEYRCTCS